jgi:hypothetical protein
VLWPSATKAIPTAFAAFVILIVLIIRDTSTVLIILNFNIVHIVTTAFIVSLVDVYTYRTRLCTPWMQWSESFVCQRLLPGCRSSLFPS